MRKYNANNTVDEGIYLNLRRFAFKSLEEPGRLPGTADDVFVRIPALLVLPVGLLLSLAFVIFLPLVGFVMLTVLIVEKLFDLGDRGTHRILHRLHWPHAAPDRARH